jgi:hypothetical protein
MPKPIHDMASWDASSQALSSSVPAEAWQATRAQTAMQTQILRDKDDYLADAVRDIGRRIDERHHELFVSCDPAEAIQQQIGVLRPEFIAVHDIGTSSSRRLIAGVAAALGRTVQRLVIRRQGLGVGLATLEFTEIPTAGRAPLRLYTTEVDADTQSRRDIARVLLGCSRLGVVMVGDLPAHALGAALKPIADAMATSAWVNQHMLMLPLASASTLQAQAAALTGRVSVRTTPLVKRPAEAWDYLSATWNRVRDQLAPAGVDLPAIGTLQAAPVAAPVATPAPLPMQPMPEIVPRSTTVAPAGASAASAARARTDIPATPAAVAAPTAAAAMPTPVKPPMQPMPAVPARPVADRASPAVDASSELLLRYVTKLLDITGMVSACVFEVATQRSLAHAGARPGPAMLAIQGSALCASIGDVSRALGLGAALPEAAITLGAHHLMLRPIPNRPGLALHAVLDKTAANLTLARLQILRLDAMLDEGKPAT